MALNMIACGSFLIPMIPVCISFAGEVTFPLPEAVSVSILMMAGQLSGLVFGFIGTFIFDISSLGGVRQASVCNAMYVSLCVVASVCSLLVDEDLKRLKCANENKVEPELKETGVLK
jgi:hypothetical protein